MQDLTKLLETLATKLGTTAQYLWTVLIKQAKIDATIDLLIFVLTVITMMFLYKLHKRFSKKDERDCSAYDKNGELLGAPMVIVAISTVVIFLTQVCSISTILSGFFNPEYWALNKILSQLK